MGNPRYVVMPNFVKLYPATLLVTMKRKKDGPGWERIVTRLYPDCPKADHHISHCTGATANDHDPERPAP